MADLWCDLDAAIEVVVMLSSGATGFKDELRKFAPGWRIVERPVPAITGTIIEQAVGQTTGNNVKYRLMVPLAHVRTIVQQIPAD